MTRGRPRHDDRGDAAIDFLLVGALTGLLVAALLQFAVVLHVRNTAIDAASTGARTAALLGNGEAEGYRRTKDLLTASLGGDFAAAADITVRISTADDVPFVVVEVLAPLPVIGLLGPPRTLEITGRAVAEVLP